MLDNPPAAQRLLNNVADKILLIEENPLLYPLYHDEYLAARGYRFAVIANYLLFYKVDEADKTIYFLRLIYGYQNIIDIV
ncbi:MAG: type II toxin-antitoxin system RelE/ParE family toxin [Eubacterium sp.]|nr:type II toxin-antitoxin system RelE/ParE family toxin [Eubacterium sp.]